MSEQGFHFLLKDLWPYGLVFARWLGAGVALPGFASSSITSRIRILFALGLSVCLTPLLSARGVFLSSTLALIPLLYEVLIGLFLGVLVRIAFEALEVTGTLISHHSALSNVLTQSFESKEQSALPSSFLTVIMLTLFFTHDMHHLVFRGVVISYEHFPPGGTELFVADMAHLVTQVLARGFQVALQIGAPFLVFGIAFFITVGLLNRLMPQLQVFFITQPLEIFLGFAAFFLTFRYIVSTFSAFFTDSLSFFLKAT